MKKITKVLLLSGVITMLSGCISDGTSITQMMETKNHNKAFLASLPDPNASYAPLPKNYKQQILAYMNSTLKDPDSAKYSDHTVRKTYIVTKYLDESKVKLTPNNVMYGQEVCMLVNAKNSYGGYTGNQLYWFFFENGKLSETYNTSPTARPLYYYVGKDDKKCPDFW